MDSSSYNNFAGLTFAPLLVPNAIFLTIFVIFWVMHSFLVLLHYRWFGYGIGMVCGLLLEFLGYVAKVQLHQNPKRSSAYILYIISLTLGPVFLSSSLYLGVASIQRCYRTRIFRISPNWFAALFILGDFLCLCFIGVGGSLAAIFAPQKIGPNLMIVGLAIQVLFTVIFCFCLFLTGLKIFKRVKEDRRAKYFYFSLLSSLCLLIRSGWRVAELSEGFNGPLTAKEGIFIALDSVPMILLSVFLTVLHPSIWFSGGYDAKEKPSLDSAWHTRSPRYIALIQRKGGW